MKKLFILVFALSVHMVAFGQRTVHTAPIAINSYSGNDFSVIHSNPDSRATATGDTFILSNIPVNDTPLVIYPAAGSTDSGYLTGTNIFNDMGFAESYTINGADSTLVVIGVVALFHGTITSSSLQTITFDAWDETPWVIRTSYAGSYAYSGMPNDCLDSLIVPATQLGIGATTDTLKTFLFPAFSDTVGNSSFDPYYVGNSFFVGYTVNYNFGLLTGDTLGLACSINGDRTNGNTFTYGSYSDSVLSSDGTDNSLVTIFDTTVNVQNVTQWSDYSWHDNYTDNDSMLNDLAIYPIVVIGTAGVTNVSRKGLAFFGNYPNPAVDYTNIKFSLAQTADVTIQIMDMNGHAISTINNASMSLGQHIIPVNTSCMPSGNYLYFIHTSLGDGIAGKMTVLR